MEKSILEQKFGISGKIGSDGEDFVYELIQNFYDEVIDDRNNFDAQCRGWDFRVRQFNWKTQIKLEAKTNLYETSKGFKFPVEIEIHDNPGDFIKSEAHRFMHVNRKTYDYLYYDHIELRKFVLRKLNLPDNWIHNLIYKASGGDNAKLLWIHTTDDRFKPFLKIFKQQEI